MYLHLDDVSLPDLPEIEGSLRDRAANLRSVAGMLTFQKDARAMLRARAARLDELADLVKFEHMIAGKAGKT